MLNFMISFMNLHDDYDGISCIPDLGSFHSFLVDKLVIISNFDELHNSHHKTLLMYFRDS